MALTTNLSALVLWLLTVVSLCVNCSLFASTSKPDPLQPLQQRISVLALADESLIDGVSQLSQTAGMAFAIEHILKPSVKSAKTADPTFTAEIRGKTLREVLDWLCQMDPRYTWVSDSKTINIIPRSKLKDKQYLMNRTLHHFRLLNALRASQPVFRGLKELPGPREQLAFLQVGGNLSYREPWTQDFAEVSVRELLNLSARRLGPTFGWQLSGSEDFRIITFHAWLPSTKHAAPHSPRSGAGGILVFQSATIPSVSSATAGVLSFAPLLSQNPPEDTAKLHPESVRVPNVKLENATALEVSRDALAEARVAGGIVRQQECSPDERRSYRPSRKNLGAVLDSIAAGEPGASWSVEEGVVNVQLSRQQEPLLDVMLGEVVIDPQTQTLDRMLDDLLLRPEVRRRSEELALGPIVSELGLRPLPRPGAAGTQKQTAVRHLQNVSLRRALNALASAHGHAVWLYERIQCGKRKLVRVNFVIQ